MQLVDNTYFENRELFIPNNTDLNAEPVGTASAQSELDAMIIKYERELMINALGVTLYDELVTAINDLPGADQKWKDLVTGRNYTIDSKVYRWDGLRGFSKQSLVAFYVYTQYLVNDEMSYTTVGVVQNEANNAEVGDYTSKYIKARNSFLEQYQGDLYNYYTRHVDMYYSGDYRNHCNLNYLDSINLYKQYTRKVQASLWQYLNDANDLDATAFPDFQFKVYSPQNRFGI